MITSGRKSLIIGGASKAGTTSVFDYLSKHPQICASEAKETRFFLDDDYPLPSRMRCAQDGPGAYLSFFEGGGLDHSKVYDLEATPDYLYSDGTPRRIRETLPNVRFIFILREPLARLLSFYRFGQQMNEIPASMSFDQYIELQRNNSGENFPEGYRHPAFCALQHGRYSLYLKRFLSLFGRANIYITFYDQLQRDPSEFMMSMSRWIGIEESYFQDYLFTVRNKTVKVRNASLHRAYFETRQMASNLLRHSPGMRSVLGKMGRRVHHVYWKMNVTKSREVPMSSATADFISSYYEEEAAQLRELMGAEVPWIVNGKSGSAAFEANVDQATRNHR